ncbi:hypothetical protein OG802_31785 [Streptomyces sp. NBC_00704]|uniref:hypothetical protein n=1 Tax=Streptomyces sp. NBC_00704 TaxID=2975809 RepID=UPI002E319281|nr:hypothetical protein [Streptomyces sp. NBC_00704]
MSTGEPHRRVLALRLGALFPWRGMPMPAGILVAFVLQGTAALPLTAALAVGRDLAPR